MPRLAGRILLLGGLLVGTAGCWFPPPPDAGPTFLQANVVDEGCDGDTRSLTVLAEVTSPAGVTSVRFAFDDGSHGADVGLVPLTAGSAIWTTHLFLPFDAVVEGQFTAVDGAGRTTVRQGPRVEVEACPT